MAPQEVRRQARETDRRAAWLSRMCGHEDEEGTEQNVGGPKAGEGLNVLRKGK